MTSVSGRPESATAPVDPGLFELLVDSVQDYAIFALDPRGHVLTWNVGAQRIKGYRPEEIIGKHFSIFYPPEDVARGKTGWELDVARREGRFEDEDWRIRKDGSRFWANVIITALRNDRGDLVGFAKVTRDLSDRRIAEEALREREERFRLIVQSVKDYAIFMLDPEGNIATWNEGAQRIKGYTAHEIIGKHFSIFYPETDLAAGKPAFELREAVRVGRFEDEGWRIRKDGTRFWSNVIITPLLRPNGELLGYAKVTRDLTERKAAEERAADDAARLAAAEASSRVKSEFLATMSHELRTPLNAIGGYAQLLELGPAGPVTPVQQQYIDRIRGSQQHLLRIINDLLNYSRLEAGHARYQLASIALHEVVDRAIAMVAPQAASKQITLAHGECSPDVVAWADEPKVEQIVLNVLSNAVKFTAPGGHVTLLCGTGDDYAMLTISDTGPGVPEDKREAVFEPFVQLDRSLTNPKEGTGLGLSISRDLARAMGGDLVVTPKEGPGAAFTLTLPLPR